MSAPGPSADSPRLRLRSPGEILALIPYLLGFHPSESLVLVAVRGPRRRVVCTLRWDLPAVRSRFDRESAVSAIRSRLALVEGDAAVLVVYTRRAPGSRGLPLASLVSTVQAAEVPLLDTLLVHAERWWSYLCTDPRRCPPTGTPLPAVTEPGGASGVAAAAVLAGRTALPSRAALAATLRPVDGATRASVDAAVARGRAELAARLAGGATVEEIRAESVRLVRTALRGVADPCGAACAGPPGDPSGDPGAGPSGGPSGNPGAGPSGGPSGNPGADPS